MTPRGKGRILHLGAYLSKDGKPIEILSPRKDNDGSDSRANWNVTTGQIKVSYPKVLVVEVDTLTNDSSQ